MLIRTSHYKCKASVAVLIRVILFFGIPSFYMLFLRVDGKDGETLRQQITELNTGNRLNKFHKNR